MTACDYLSLGEIDALTDAKWYSTVEGRTVVSAYRRHWSTPHKADFASCDHPDCVAARAAEMAAYAALPKDGTP